MSRPKKKWGQNFLRNRGAAERIAAAVEPAAEDVVVEIGPGEGALTEKLIDLGRPLIAIEIDPELAERLKKRYGERITIRHEDALEAPLPETSYRAVGNLPYNVGTPILRRVVADPHCRRAVFMLQKEVADRVVALPGSDAYGYLTLYVRLFADARAILTLEPRSFHPPPKVRSAVVVLDPVARPLLSHRDDLLDLVSAAFRMRRKTLVNNLLGWRSQSREAIVAALRGNQLSDDVRAEQLPLEAFDAIAAALLHGS